MRRVTGGKVRIEGERREIEVIKKGEAWILNWEFKHI